VRYHVSPKVTARYFIAFDGHDQYPYRLSATKKVAVAPYLALRKSAGSPYRTGKWIDLYVTSRPHTNIRVHVQQRRNGSWHNLGRLRLDPDGFATISVRFYAAGVHPVRLVYDNSPDLAHAVSNTVRLRVTSPAPAAPSPTVDHACTTTSTGSCIRGGEFCPQASYGETGWDANGVAWVCTGDPVHPHWE
jgi:hypothetical protein